MTGVGSWRYIPKKGQKESRGVQVDMLFDRSDGVIQLCEIRLRDWASFMFLDRTGSEKALISPRSVFAATLVSRGGFYEANCTRGACFIDLQWLQNQS